MKVITRAVFQMTPEGFELLEEDSYDYDGPIAEAKGGYTPSIDANTQAGLIKQSADLNRTNTAGTYGSSEWSIDPTTGRYTQNVSIDPSQQRQLDSRNAIAENLIGDAGKQFSHVGGPFDYSSDVSPSARASFDRVASRMAPDFELQSKRQDQDLANGGIPVGSEAYNNEQRKLDQSQSDQLYNAAEGSANTQNQMDVNERQQQFSDIANLLGERNMQTPTQGTNAAIDTTGNFNTLNGGIQSLRNQAASQQQSGTSALMAALAAFA
jgi:hypothetical protein